MTALALGLLAAVLVLASLVLCVLLASGAPAWAETAGRHARRQRQDALVRRACADLDAELRALLGPARD